VTKIFEKVWDLCVLLVTVIVFIRNNCISLHHKNTNYAAYLVGNSITADLYRFWKL